MADLTPKQRLFVHEYLIDTNATQAAIRAGYSARTAGSIGDENLRKPAIKALVQKALENRIQRLEASQDRALLEILRIALSDLRGVVSWSEDGGAVLIPSDEITDDAAAAVESIEITSHWEGGKGEDEAPTLVKRTKVKMHSKGPMIRLLAEHLGMTKDQRTGQLPTLVVGLLEHIDREHYLTPEHRQRLNPANEVSASDNGKVKR